MAEPINGRLVGVSVERRGPSNTVREIIEEDVVYGIIGRSSNNKPITHPSSDVLLD